MSVYVMSDLHGRHDLFEAMLEKISFGEEDYLYLLGDIADRGPDGVRTYLYLTEHSNIFLLAGNHEIMFLNAFRRLLLTGDGEEFYLSREWRLWDHNGGEATWEQFRVLPGVQQMEIIDYIRGAFLVIPELKVNGRVFYLCHSTHADRRIKGPLLLSEASPEETEHVVWDRVYPANRRKNALRDEDSSQKYRNLYTQYPAKLKMVFGHTPTSFLKGVAPDGRSRIYHGGKGHLIDIDCGCAAFDPQAAMLGCLRLDDLKEFYVPGNHTGAVSASS